MLRTLTKILLVDDNVPLRTAVRLLLRTEPSFDLIGEAGDGATAVRMAAELSPDVVIMDIHMPGAVDGIEATRQIRAAGAAENPAPQVIGFSAGGDHRRQMLEAGAIGFVAKEGVAELIAKVKSMLAGA